MPVTEASKFKYSWEEAIELLRKDPEHSQLIHDSYLTSDLVANSRRFAASAEFAEALRLIKEHSPDAIQLLDIPGGNGIATAAFAAAGFVVTTVEPNPSVSVGRGAIAQVLDAQGLRASVVDAWGEKLPFSAATFDVVYVRQGLHHASDLAQMLREYGRVLKPGGLLLACREHVVDNYGGSLQAFLATQVDHQLYGGEHAFTLRDYRAALSGGHFALEREFGPFDSVINFYPNTPETLRSKILHSRAGRLLRSFLPDGAVTAVGAWWLRHARTPGRLYSFVAVRQPTVP
jgi:SAM-dependent methyltransferase